MMADTTSGERIRECFGRARQGILIVAPFIKTEALRSLLSVVEEGVAVRCVTRWLPQDVADGVSDLDVFDLLESRDHSELVLVDRLHAKLYVADDRCLVGSANVTFAGLGESREANLEILVESDIADPSVASVLHEIDSVGRPASRLIKESTQRLVDSLPEQPSIRGWPTWLPISRNPGLAYRTYDDPPTGELTTGTRLLLQDIATANLPAGLTHDGFKRAIRSRLAAIPIAGEILAATEDMLLTRSDAQYYLSTKETDTFAAQDIWMAFVKWMAYFHSDSVMEQEISEVALRRAQVLKP